VTGLADILALAPQERPSRLPPGRTNQNSKRGEDEMQVTGLTYFLKLTKIGT
jgi:hypothetical protein